MLSLFCTGRQEMLADTAAEQEGYDGIDLWD